MRLFCIEEDWPKKASEITFSEADAMATFWHEITHNRHLSSLTTRLSQKEIDVMEMMNEFVARKTLPEFYKGLGVRDVPHPEFMNSRQSTAYNPRVIAYDYVVQMFGLDAKKVLTSAKSGLFSSPYSLQDQTAKQALIEGGLNKFKGVNGKTLSNKQLTKIVNMCRDGRTTSEIEIYLKEEKIIHWIGGKENRLKITRK